LVGLVEHVGAVARRAGQHDRSGARPVARSLDAVADRLAEGLGETVEQAHVEEHPAAAGVAGPAYDLDNLGPDHARVTD
jgi:hypothetical protein